MPWSRVIPRALDSLAAALLSAPCAVCGRVALRLSTGAICDACWESVALLTPPLCDRCGAPRSGRAEAPPRVREPEALPRALGGGGALCPAEAGTLGCACDDLPAGVDAARAVGPYEGVLRSAIHALKYDRRRSVALRLARLASERCASIFDGADLIVPVPLHARRRWARGFNQAHEIARHLPLPLRPALRRTRHTPSQAALTGSSRARNVKDAFAGRLFARRGLMGSAVVLVDDVSTTGATLAACAEVLRDLGARDVRALTVARTVRVDRAA
jgi:ComF family protein